MQKNGSICLMLHKCYAKNSIQNEKNGLHRSTFIAIILNKIVGYLHILAFFEYFITAQTC